MTDKRSSPMNAKADEVESVVREMSGGHGVHRDGGGDIRTYYSGFNISELLRRLASAATSEPVAWRWYHANDPARAWNYQDTPIGNHNEYIQVQPLYTAPPSSAVTARGRHTYPHMCRDDHVEIGHSDSEHEQCPLCRLASVLEQIRDDAATKPNGGAWAAGLAVIALATLPGRPHD